MLFYSGLLVACIYFKVQSIRKHHDDWRLNILRWLVVVACVWLFGVNTLAILDVPRMPNVSLMWRQISPVMLLVAVEIAHARIEF